MKQTIRDTIVKIELCVLTILIFVSFMYHK